MSYIVCRKRRKENFKFYTIYDIRHTELCAVLRSRQQICYILITFVFKSFYQLGELPRKLVIRYGYIQRV